MSAGIIMCTYTLRIIGLVVDDVLDAIEGV